LPNKKKKKKKKLRVKLAVAEETKGTVNGQNHEDATVNIDGRAEDEEDEEEGNPRLSRCTSRYSYLAHLSARFHVLI
jgi:hypothetical protein